MTAGMVLVATDFSDDSICAGERAAALCALLDAPIELLHVVSDSWLDALGLRLGTRDVVERVRAEAAVALARQAQALRTSAWAAASPSGPGGAIGEVSVNLLEGAVIDRVARRALEAELLVVGAHGERPFRDAALGSTGERLIRRSRGPVLVVRRATPARADRGPGPRTGPWRRILVGIDLSPYSAPALRWARRLGAGARIEILHAFEAPFESKLRLAGVSNDEIVRLRADTRESALRRLRALTSETGFAEGEVPLSAVHGYAPHRIVDRAREMGAGLIVIGKHGEARLEDLLLGSVALHVLAQASCDVLVVQAVGAQPGKTDALP